MRTNRESIRIGKGDELRVLRVIIPTAVFTI